MEKIKADRKIFLDRPSIVGYYQEQQKTNISSRKEEL